MAQSSASHLPPRLARAKKTQRLALGLLLVMGAIALIGPSGLFALSSANRALARREVDLKALASERDGLKNRVALLDPRHVDPDLAGELLRSNLNVIHPDEKVMLLN